MQPQDVIAVVGSCAPERFGAARRLAQRTESPFIPASRLAMCAEPIPEAASLVQWTASRRRTVVEFPTITSMTDLIATLSDTAESGTRLLDIICVIDAAHILDDLRRDDYIVRRSMQSAEGRSRSLITVEQIEFASTALLVGWEALSTPDLSTVMALISHLSPLARLRLHGAGPEHVAPFAPHTADHERPGWVGILNDDFSPHMTDPRVSFLRYERLRPMHPERLSRLLDERVAAGAFGTVLRSAGFCRLASRPRITGRWEHVGQMFSLHPLLSDHGLAAEDDAAIFGQNLAFIGLDLDRAALVEALDAAVLDDDEFAAGPHAWARLSDPFPVSRTAAERSDRGE